MWFDLLRIKEFRERQAETALARERTLLALAQRERDAAERSFLDYQQYAADHERVMYNGLMQRTVKLREIETVQRAVVQLRQEELRLGQAAQRAAQMRDAAAARTEAAREQHRAAEKIREKFLHLAREHDDELRAEVEREEDLEIEEAASVARDRADWEEHRQEAT